MKETYWHCTKYDKWKKKDRNIQNLEIFPDCKDLERKICGLCEFNKVEWVEDE